ncbi:MAG TPA: restriction endonuclease subunit S, partial [Gallicola sp.]|nr:restriction endonuclease subunit S [Gallicola sp.]
KLKEVLKSKILDSAIHGTLVDNDSNLKPIEVEEVKDDVTFDIPSNWKWTKWRNLSSSIQYGVSASATDSGNAKLVRITDIQNNEVVWNSVPFCKINEKDIEKYLLKENDILFARTGGTVGKSVMVKNIPSDNNYVFAGYLIRSNYDDTKAFYKYLKMFMDSSLYWEQLKKGSIGMAQPNCNGKTLGNMFIPLPPLEEQKKIVEKIESLFELIEQL